MEKPPKGLQQQSKDIAAAKREMKRGHRRW
jgi:hypothetical protein